MTLLLAFPALAALPWECPAITVPADADVYRDNDGGLVDTWEGLYDAAYAYVDEGCAWVETTTIEYTTTTTERVCEGAGSTVTWTASVYEDSGSPAVHTETTTYVVELPSNETWTRLEVTQARTRSSSTGSSYGGDVALHAVWTGALPGLPDDAWFSVEEGYWSSMSGSSRSRSVDTPACSFAWRSASADYDTTEVVSAPDHWAEVTVSYGSACVWGMARAKLDGAMAGMVAWETWERDLSDADGDGLPVGACDCDGADDVDAADGDGYTADGDDEPADCDDARWAVNPGWREVTCDGIDQDCDGEDLCDDTAPEDTAAEAPPDEPPAEDTEAEDPPAAAVPEAGEGCGGAAAWLMFVPLLGIRRRRR